MKEASENREQQQKFMTTIAGPRFGHITASISNNYGLNELIEETTKYLTAQLNVGRLQRRVAAYVQLCTTLQTLCQKCKKKQNKQTEKVKQDCFFALGHIPVMPEWNESVQALAHILSDTRTQVASIIGRHQRF